MNGFQPVGERSGSDCKAEGKDSTERKSKGEEMGVGGEDFELWEAQTVESYFRLDWN